MFQSEILLSKFSKADLKTVSMLKIQARTTCTVRLGTAKGTRHTPMAASFKFKSGSKIGNIDLPQIFAQPG
jgi:hypothetical protein